MMIGLCLFTEQLRDFRQLIDMMAEKCFEPLKRRNGFAYAEVYSYFYMQTLSAGGQVFGNDFEQSIPMEVSFVPMMHPAEEGNVVIAEKATFNSLTDYLQTEFCPGLATGNLPRRCHNCGRYFLLVDRYGTCTATTSRPVRRCAPGGKWAPIARRLEARNTGLRLRKNMTGPATG